jgi:hypothetical protein
MWGWKQWALGGGGVMAAAVILLVVSSAIFFRPVRQAEMAQQVAPSPEAEGYGSTRQPNDQPAVVKGKLAAGSAAVTQFDSLQAARYLPETRAGGGGAPLPTPQAAAAPMIARTVSLTIVVKDFAAARASLDSILLRHRGYAAQLTAATQENAPRSLQASLRIPAPELAAALAELKTLGRVQNESQSGEEVTQQHTDLVARLQNSRETEERLRAILEQRTGKIEDVLQVEEEIARVRGEIEQMEAEQQALEHRVEFASVDLQLTEEYKAELNSPSGSVWNRLRNAFVAGLRNAAETILGIVLFLEEDGPVLLIWLAILGLPVFLLVRRYRRMRARL